MAWFRSKWFASKWWQPRWFGVGQTVVVPDIPGHEVRVGNSRLRVRVKSNKLQAVVGNHKLEARTVED